MIDGNRVIHEARYPHSPERVWRALTDREELAAWLMPNDFTAEVGARFRFDARPHHAEPFDCEMLELDPPRRLRMQWMVDGQPSIVTFELTPDGDHTLLRVEHDGLSDDERPNFEGGWGHKLATDIPQVLDGTRAAADATTTSDGLVRHPALKPE